jgi:hypothetical protein
MGEDCGANLVGRRWQPFRHSTRGNDSAVTPTMTIIASGYCAAQQMMRSKMTHWVIRVDFSAWADVGYAPDTVRESDVPAGR